MDNNQCYAQLDTNIDCQKGLPANLIIATLSQIGIINYYASIGIPCKETGIIAKSFSVELLGKLPVDQSARIVWEICVRNVDISTVTSSRFDHIYSCEATLIPVSMNGTKETYDFSYNAKAEYYVEKTHKRDDVGQLNHSA